MFWTVVCYLGILLLVRELFKPVPAPINGVYRQPGRWYHLKRIIFLFMFKLRQWKKRKEKTLQEGNSGYGASVSDPEKMEDNPPLMDSPFAIDSVYFGGFNKDGVYLAARVARRHGRHSEVWLYLRIPGVGDFHHPVHPDTLVSNVTPGTLTAGGLRIEMLEPMMKWKISFNGLLRKGVCKELDREDGTLTYTKFSFIWKAMTDPFNFDTNISPRALADAMAREEWTRDFFNRLQRDHQTHYEQWGELCGRIQVEGREEQLLRLKAVRDHSYGVRDWRSFHRYVIHFIFTQDGTIIQVGVVSMPENMSHLKVGYLMFPSSQTFSVEDTDIKLWEVAPDEGPLNEYSFKLTAGGMTFCVDVKGEVTPEWYHHEDRGSRIYEKCCRYVVNGKPAYGITEFQYRNSNGPSYLPPSSLPLLCEPRDLASGSEKALTLCFTEEACCSTRLVGGKGSQLGLLSSVQDKEEFAVTKGFCITLQAFRTQLQKYPSFDSAITKIEESFRSGNIHEKQSICSEAVEAIAGGLVSDDVRSAILSAMKDVFGANHEHCCVAVRSSASGEDGSEASGAGQMETFLGVCGAEKILKAVSKCWASAFTYQAVQYRRQNGQPIRVLVGVVIQEMVKSEVSGVLFTNHPVTGSSGHMVIDASYGLGEAVVSGKSTPDSITVQRNWKDNITIQNKQIGSKGLRITVKEEGGLQEESVSKGDMCCLSDLKIEQLCQIGIKLEHYFGSPRDIEWALSGEKFYLLQARPITTLDEVTDDDLINEFDDPLITDKEWLTTGNIGEMMPGAVTPLTYSVFASATDQACLNVMVCLCGNPRYIYPRKYIIGCRGHLFINLMPNESGALNNIFGKKEDFELNLCGEPLPDLSVDLVKAYHGKFTDRLSIILTTIKYIAVVSREAQKKCDDWFKRADTYTITDKSSDSQQMYQDINKRLPDYTEIWKAGVLKSANSGAWSAATYGVLRQGKLEMTREVCSDVAQVLSHCDNVYSAEVPVAIQGLAREIVNSGVQDTFMGGTDKECVDLLSSDSIPTVNRKYQDFMKRHGHRYIREAELMEKSWDTHPERLVQVLKKIITMGAYEERKQTSILSDKDIIEQLKTPLSNGEKRSLKFILPRARKAVGEREFGKSLCIKVADKFKQAYWSLAEKMVEEGRLPDKELLFFLTHREIGQLLKTRSPKLITKANRRRKLLPKLMNQTFSRYSIGLPNPQEQENFEEQRKPHFVLSGMPICKGRVSGKARVVKTLAEANSIQKDDILIVSYTDVGWTPYFPLLGGLVTEMGGLVSHGAVVAREFQLPCVVNVPNATQLLKSGDEVVLDGLAGKIEKLEGSEKD
ncbi:uncharacterized phosphotransferase YvkC-like isoform X2 [Saccostrea echinata]|uniref:uncharacterized phosphotransferase YvkC-like isoform X1 n=1 Tax=Saccostrea echinata TaxID=191078 RepID=UPI002A801B3D|nr:uncharacterized phosphotransferase YvkC-like isoform X1 [Saccostrea echinata]XP_061179946.1 uncharacterized phosphotransferase YvkC-like isoform X2 [Saccostrea echinata]